MHLIIYKYRFEVLWDGSHLSIFWPNGGYQEVHSMDPAGTFDFWWFHGFHDVASKIHCSQSCVEYVIDIYKPLPHEGLYRRAYPLDTSGRIWKVKWMWYFWIFWATKGYPLWINDEACALCQAFSSFDDHHWDEVPVPSNWQLLGIGCVVRVRKRHQWREQRMAALII